MNEILVPNARLYASCRQHLDSRPQFSEEIWADWEKTKQEQFESHWPKAQAVMEAFEELGIYLLDVTPNNIAFLD